jgi:hypothetical protein
MHIFADGYSYAKIGNRPDENEDSFWLEKADDSVASLTAAISDGATQSIFAGAWSKLLVEHFGVSGFRGNEGTFRKEIRSLQECWLQKATEKPLPWYAEHKVQRGAFASLLAIRIFEAADPPSLRWASAAIGDSCLFHIRGNQWLAYPLQCSDAFDANPLLICSNDSANASIEEKIDSREGSCHLEDTFFLTTDMVARCILRILEEKELPWESLLETDSVETFQNWVEKQRLRFGVKNDDATMVRIRILE